MDCQGTGPLEGRFKRGRKVFYSREQFVEWFIKESDLTSKSETLGNSCFSKPFPYNNSFKILNMLKGHHQD